MAEHTSVTFLIVLAETPRSPDCFARMEASLITLQITSACHLAQIVGLELEILLLNEKCVVKKDLMRGWLAIDVKHRKLLINKP